MKKTKIILMSLALMLGFGLTLVPSTAGAINLLSSACDGEAAKTAVCKSKGDDDLKTFIKDLVNSLLYVLGAVCVIVIIIAGIFYATSSGNSAQVEKAKNTILYSVVGLIVALLAYAIINWVLGTLSILK